MNIDLKDPDIEVREDSRGNKIAWSKSGGGPIGELPRDTPATVAPKVKAKTETKSDSMAKEAAPVAPSKTEGDK